jgi:protein O-mannosyl-transferase
VAEGINLDLISKKRAFVYITCIVLGTLAVYYPVSRHPFLNYDDDLYVLYNPHERAGLAWETIKWAFTSFYAANWHPLTWLSHALDCQLFRTNPVGHHAVNLFFHLVDVLLLFWVLRRATGYVGRSAMVAAMFALHPINVESVAWIAERKNLLSMMFFLLALGTYHWYASAPRGDAATATRDGALVMRTGRYLAIVLLFACGLMAKPQVITLPFVLLLWDYWPLGRMFATSRRDPAATAEPARTFSWLVLEKVPLLALSIASAVITLTAQHESGAMNGPHWQPFPIRFENAMVVYVRYLGKAIWPSNLSLIYPHPGRSLEAWQILAASLLLLVVSFLVIRVRHRRPHLLVGWLWFLGTLVPMIGLVQVGVQAMADRYAYLPFVGLFIMAVWETAAILEEWRDAATTWQVGASIAVLTMLAVTTRHQLDYWSDNVKLWSRVMTLQSNATRNNPNDWVAENNLGHALLDIGQEEQAMQHFRAAVKINPADGDSTLNIGAYEQGHNHFFGALEQYKKVIVITQNTPQLNLRTRAQAFRNMGHAYRQIGDYTDARECFQQAANLNPADGESWLGLGIMSHKLGDLSTAIQAYSNALKVEPLDWVYVLMAKTLEENGRREEARIAMEKARMLSRDFAQTQFVAKKVLEQ